MKMKVVIKVENACDITDVLKYIAKSIEDASTDYPNIVLNDEVEVVIDSFDSNLLYGN